MKKIYLTLAVMAAHQLIAQPTFNKERLFPVNGETYVTYGANPSGFSPGAAGANQTWDFSSLTPISQSNSVVSAPSGQNSASFSGSNLMIKGVGRETFYMVNDNEVRLGGYADSVGAAGAFVIYVLQDFNDSMPRYLSSSMTYNTTFSSNVAYNFNYFAPGSSSPSARMVTGTVTTLVDGYGTVNLPGGTTVNDVLRIKYTESLVVTQNGNVVDSYQRESYEWREAFTTVPLVTYETLSKQNAQYNSRLSYMSGDATGVIETSNQNQVKFFPNPSQGKLFFEGVDADDVVVKVYDLQGKLAHQGNLVAGRPFDVDELTNGLYILELSSNNTILLRQKFLKN